MTGGKITLCPHEADVVDRIFKAYLDGDSYAQIAANMIRQRIGYHRDTNQWNKHMVKRILENSKYIGHEQYPRIIQPMVYNAAQSRRNLKTAGWKRQPVCTEMVKPKTVCAECGKPFRKTTSTNPKSINRWWHCSNEECSCTLRMSDADLEKAILKIINRIIDKPELIEIPEHTEPLLSLEISRLTNEITRELGKADFNEEYTRMLITACAAEKYEMCNDSSAIRKTQEMKANIEGHAPLTTFDPGLFIMTVEAVLISQDGTLTMQLINGQVIS